MTIQLLLSPKNGALIIDKANNVIAHISYTQKSIDTCHEYSLHFLGAGVEKLPTSPDAPLEDAIRDSVKIVCEKLTEKLKRDTRLAREASDLMQNLMGPNFKLERRDQYNRLTF